MGPYCYNNPLWEVWVEYMESFEIINANDHLPYPREPETRSLKTLGMPVSSLTATFAKVVTSEVL